MRSVEGPGTGSAFAAVSLPRPRQLNTSGSTTSSAPSACARRIHPSASRRLASLSEVASIWTAAARNCMGLLQRRENTGRRTNMGTLKHDNNIGSFLLPIGLVNFSEQEVHTRHCNRHEKSANICATREAWYVNLLLKGGDMEAQWKTKTDRIRRRLEKDGWFLTRHGSGHDVYKHPRITGIITLPRHKTLSPGVVPLHREERLAGRE